MSRPSTSRIFLERASYKQRRLIDAARLLPLVGVLLWSIPLLWGPEDDTVTSNADALLYVFGVWVLLIGLSALIVGKLQDDDATSTAGPPD